MRHRKQRAKLGRTGSHKRCMMANMLKSLVYHGRIETTIAKAKELKIFADKLITVAKKNTLAAKRSAIAKLMIRFNTLTPKEAKLAKSGNLSAYNVDRQVINILFGALRERFETRAGGYTRIIRTDFQVGDNAPKCIIEYLPE